MFVKFFGVCIGFMLIVVVGVGWEGIVGYICMGMECFFVWLVVIGVFKGVGGGVGLIGCKCLFVNVFEGIVLGMVIVEEVVMMVWEVMMLLVIVCLVGMLMCIIFFLW